LHLNKLYKLINNMNANFNTTMVANQKVSSGKFNAISRKVDTTKQTVAKLSINPAMILTKARHATRSQTLINQLLGDNEVLEELPYNAVDKSWDNNNNNNNKENMDSQVTNKDINQ
jgi:hypothetical protein